MSRSNPIRVAWSIDFDAVSGWLGTNKHPRNNVADYSAGYSSAYVGVPRLLKFFKELDIADKVTWCIPGHSIETFPEETRAIVESGAEIAVHGYAHESGDQLTDEQDRDVIDKCSQLIESVTGKPPRGYRAPLYQLKERTLKHLRERNFLWDSSLSHYDSTPYFLPEDPPPIQPIDFKPEAQASDWMRPSPNFLELKRSTLVEIPGNWYTEDQTPLQFFPNTPSSHGYVDVRVIKRMWIDRYEWLSKEVQEGRDDIVLFGIIIHPDTAGMAHIIGMIERFLKWLKVKEAAGECIFQKYEDIAEEYVTKHRKEE